MKAVAQIERVKVPRQYREKIHFTFPDPPRSGEEVNQTIILLQAYDGNLVLFDLNLSLKRNDRVALVGQNGAGKTTLLKNHGRSFAV